MYIYIFNRFSVVVDGFCNYFSPHLLGAKSCKLTKKLNEGGAVITFETPQIKLLLRYLQLFTHSMMSDFFARCLLIVILCRRKSFV